MKIKLHNLSAPLALALALLGVSRLGAQTTAFTYQGALNLNGGSANGIYDLRFAIYDSASGLNLIGGPLTNAATGVSNGLFTVTLDFGAGVFTGPNRWLEMAVATNGGAFSTLAPRQQVTSTPYAIQAANAGTAASAGAVNAAGIQGILSPTQLPPVVVTNGASGLILSGAFSGNGAGLTNLNPSNIVGILGTAQIPNLDTSKIASGTLADARLSANVALLNANQTFSGSNTLSGVALLTNANNTLAGNGNALTALNAANLTGSVPGAALTSVPAGSLTGTVADARLSANVALLNANQTFTGSNTLSGVAVLTNVNNTLTGTHSGNGAGLTGLNAGNVSNGTLADARLSTNVALLNANQRFIGSNTFSGVALLTNANNTLLGNGAGLTALNAGNVSSGTLADARLSTNVALLSANQTFSGAVQFAGTATSGSFIGNAIGLTNLDLGLNSDGAILPLGFTLVSQPVSDNLKQVVVADVNGDGKPDLIAAGIGGNKVYVLTNNGGGAFVPRSTLAVGPGLQSVAAADFNGDGKPDLVSANYYSNSVSIWTNDGSGGFVLSATFTVGSAPVSVIAADVNSDGKPDLVSANLNSRTLSILTNNGSGGFTLASSPAVPFASGNNNLTVVAADVNGDGKADLAVSDYYGLRVFVLTNAGSGGFSLVSSNLVLDGPFSVTAADVNGDGKADLITANLNPTGTLTVLTNDGSGGFALASSPATGGSYPISVAAVDLNGDGRLDLVCANQQSNSVSILINLGRGIFQLRSTLAVGADPESIAVADLNGDGNPDLVTANLNSFDLSVLLNNGVQFVGSFAGNGGSISNLNAANLVGSVPAASLTSIPATNLIGTVADARLSTNVALLNANNQFTGTNGLNDRELRLRTGTDTNHALGYYGPIKPFGSFAPDGPMLFGYAGGGLGTMSGGPKVALMWNSSANVGFGTTSPDRPVSVGGFDWISLQDSGGNTRWFLNNQHGGINFAQYSIADYRLFLSTNGNVGLGTGSPEAPLHVAGAGLVLGVSGSGGGYTALSATLSSVSGGYAALQAIKQAGTSYGDLILNPNAGNVGIGITAPTNKLHVVGGATFSSGNSGGNQNVVWVPGNGSWSFTSDRNTKDRVAPVDGQAVLEKLSHVSINEWSYIGYAQRHIGPMAQDFHEQFPLNENDKALNDADLHGVALAAIQGLNQKLEQRLDQKEAEITDLKRELRELKALVETTNRK